MTTLASDLVSQVNNALLSGVRETRNKLAAAITDTTTSTLTLTYDLGGIAAGGAVYVDLEGMYVWTVDQASKTATAVERGQYGTTAATHVNGSIVYVNPRFPKPRILQALNDELADLSSPANGLFTVRTADLTYNVTTVRYDLTGVTNVEGIIDVQARYPWLTGNWEPVVSWNVERQANLTDFPSGFALAVGGGGWQGQALRVVYKDKFSPLAALADDVQTTSGASVEMNDILVLGGQLRLMNPREAKRSFTESQGDTRRADEVPVGASRAGMAEIKALRQARIAAEAARLHRLYPTKRPGR